MYQFDMDDPNDGWKPVEPADLAKVDQLEAKYKELLKLLLTAQRDISVSAMTGDFRSATKAGEVFSQGIASLGPEEFPRFISFMTMMVLSLTTQLDGTRKVVINAVNELSDALPDFMKARVLEAIWSDEHGARETFITGEGQELVGVHAAELCQAQFCLIHKPAPGPWINWPTVWPPGDSGLRFFLRRCPHGILHPAVEDMILRDWSIKHVDCDGCPCFHLDCDEIKDQHTGELLGWMEKANGS